MSEKPYRRWRHPPGCPDSDWCSGNGVCYWDCQGDPDADTARRSLEPSEDPRDPDYSRPGIFAHHNCWRCKDGTDLSRCTTPDRPGNCGYPQARDD